LLPLKAWAIPSPALRTNVRAFGSTCFSSHPSTVKRLRSSRDRVEVVRNQLIPFFGGKLLSEIKPHDVKAFPAQRMKRNGTQPCLQTINNDHTVLKHSLNVAIRRGLIVGNPASAVPCPIHRMKETGYSQRKNRVRCMGQQANI
jgi:hypothetical protein